MRPLFVACMIASACTPPAAGPAPVTVAPASSGSVGAPEAAAAPRVPVLRPERQLLLVPRPRFVQLHAPFPSPTPPERLVEHLPERFRAAWQRPRTPREDAQLAAQLRAEAARAREGAAWLWIAAGWLQEQPLPPPAAPARYGAPLPAVPEPPGVAQEAYEKARRTATPGDQAWLFASRRLLLVRWRPGREAEADERAQEAASRAIGDVPGDLWLRSGFALGALGRHEEAARSFEKATDPAHRDLALALRTLALYRARQHRPALAVALESFDAWRVSSKAASGGGPPIERWGEAQDAARRVAIDTMDALGLGPGELPAATAETQAFVLGLAAQRALFRGNEGLARARAERALELAPKTREAAAPLEVLRLLAERSGDRAGAEKLATRQAALKDESTTIRQTAPTIEEEEAQGMKEAPTAERLLTSLVHACAEPVAGGSGGLGRLTVEARIYDTGLVEARVLASGNEATRQVGECVRSQAAVALMAAPSLRATVELARLGETPRR